ncbi:MAG: hypothetical protein WC511_04075 [Candidatus Pacearchaeota archaeon]
MNEKKYYQILAEYRSGVEFDLVTSKENNITESEMRLVSLKGEKPYLKFKNGGATFNPKSVGGIKNIVSLDAKLDY